jgi:hypothetical protein
VGNQGHSSERRGHDRRQGDRRKTSRDAPDRRRTDRRHGLSAGLLGLFLVSGLAPRAQASPTRPALLRPENGGANDDLPPADAAAAYRHLIARAADRHGVSAALIEAVIRVESGFRPKAVSNKGALGLMQLMPQTAARFRVHDVFDPEQNILAGTRYLSQLLGMFGGDVELACAAYNAGEEAVRRFGGVPPYPETREYVKRIASLLSGVDRHPRAAPVSTRKRDDVFYLWYDEKGILNVSQFAPPPGVAFKTTRP